MPFDRATRERALVAAARHCCVCHRYKGVNVEVHHIVRESEGGENTADNAIAICFDCHADAGHYNPRHPRGTKFSPDELRLARDNWHATVSCCSLSPPPVEDTLYCRYLVCKSFTSLREIVSSDLGNVPASDPLLVRNSVLDFLTEIIRQHPHDYRNNYEWGDHFSSKEEYSRAHPDVAVVSRSSLNTYPYFEALRSPSRRELEGRVAPVDSVTRMLLRGRAPLAKISLAFAYTEICGDDRFQEMYRLRPLWGVFLAATNVTDRLLRLASIATMIEEPPGCAYRRFFERRRIRTRAHELPRAPLPPRATVLFPVATLLGPLSPTDVTVWRQEAHNISTGELQTVAHCDLSNARESVEKVGPAVWPSAINLEAQGEIAQQFHEFDLERLYVIDRSWECGSCPHLFFRNSGDRRLIYVGQLFGKAPGLMQSHLLVVPPGVNQVVVAEIERESTWLESLTVNSELVEGQVPLRTGDTKSLDVSPGDELNLTGYYLTGEGLGGRHTDPWLRNTLVREYLCRAT